MKKILIKINDWKFIIIIILIIGGGFYWFQIRPAHINTYCNKKAGEDAVRTYQHNNPWTSDITKYDLAQYEAYYKQCLRSRGINK